MLMFSHFQIKLLNHFGIQEKFGDTSCWHYRMFYVVWNSICIAFVTMIMGWHNHFSIIEWFNICFLFPFAMSISICVCLCHACASNIFLASITFSKPWCPQTRGSIHQGGVFYPFKLLSRSLLGLTFLILQKGGEVNVNLLNTCLNINFWI